MPSTVFQQAFISQRSWQQRELIADGKSEEILMKGLLNDVWAELPVEIEGAKEAIAPSGRKGWEDDFLLSEPSCNPRRGGYLARELAVKE